jgi:pyruvate,water dikinase
MSEVKVVSLDAKQNVDERMVGPKAASLFCMMRIGLTVPPGFCITEAAFREHLQANKLTTKIESARNKLAKAEPEAKRAILSELQQAIINAPMADIIRDDIEKHYLALAADRLAVRSSAAAEDLPGHSFAGQYETYLGVADIAGCIDAIKKCWASLWTERAYEYRKKNGFDHLKISMAVIVQSLVPADAAGVIFTTDPVTGSSSRIIIESSFGLGQALVSGKVTPDRFIINKRNLKIIYRKISDKKIECVIDNAGSAQERLVKGERINTPSIDNKTVKKLAKQAGKAERNFGCPQDIEWAVSGNRIFFLQARPVTAIPPKKSWEDRQIWCNSPAKEVMPDVVTPITWSMLLEAVGEELFDPVLRMFCYDRGNNPVYSLIAGRVYFNANLWGAVIRNLPIVRNYDFKIPAGGHKGLQQVVERLQTAADEDLPDVRFNLLRFILKTPLIIIIAFASTPRKGRRILAKISAENEKWKRLDVAGLSAEQITACSQELIKNFRKLLSQMSYMFAVLAALPVLDLICKRWLSDSSSCMGRLLAGVGDMDDAVAGLDLWRLAVVADATPEIKDLIFSNDDWRTIERKLSQLDSGRRFLENWGKFMDRHGHHCRAELELYNPRWSETPDYILKLVRTYITQIGKIDPVENNSRRVYERQQLQEQCRKKLRNPVKQMIFNRLLTRSQQGSVFRENVKSEVIKLVVAMRKLCLGLGKKLGDKGVLKNQDDLFFLRLEEVELVVQDKADFDIHQVIAARREEYNKNKSITPPDVVFGKFDPDKFIPEKEDAETRMLNGLAVSPGLASGKARVILRANADEYVLAGEILVAPFTDPGWTPYFVTAAGVVMDQGGILSHGSIIAREYGIPAVVNVGPATKIIKTGQTIQVDGNRGVVTIL